MPFSLQSTSAPIGLVLYGGGFQGWETSSELRVLLDLQGNLKPGVFLHYTMQRSPSVKFFSLFIVVLMWLVSLAMFIIALNFTISNSREVHYDVPGLAIGLLFAIPFVRDVQPNIPTVGISIDMLGFFFNMILIAAAAILAMGAVASRHARAVKAKEAARERRRQVAEGASTTHSNAVAEHA